MPRAGRLHFARRCDLPEAHGDDDDSVGQCRVAKAASRCVDARGRPAAGRLSKDRQDAVTAREKLGEEHGSQLGDVLGSRPVLVRNDLRAPDAAADHASMPTRCTSLFFGSTRCTSLFFGSTRCTSVFFAPHDVLHCFLLHTMYFTVFWLHTMYFGDFSGRWLRPLGTCKVLIPGDMRRALASQPSVAPPQPPAPCSSRAAP